MATISVGQMLRCLAAMAMTFGFLTSLASQSLAAGRDEAADAGILGMDRTQLFPTTD